MSSPSIPRPNRRWLILVGVIALVVAGAIVGEGVVSRVRAKRDLAQWTNAQAVPTVSLAALQSGGSLQRLILPGNIQPYTKAAIYARVSGYLKSWEQDIGAHVTAGQTLAVIDTPDLDQQLVQAEANLATAETNARLAFATAQRYNGLAKPEFVSKQTLDQQNSAAATAKTFAEAARATVGQLQAMESFKTLTAPFDGIVTARNTDVGALINGGNTVTGQELFEVSDLHRVRIYVQVPQAYSAGLQPGVKATFELPQYPGQTFEATLVTTSNSLNPTSRSMLVELQTDNADGKLFSNAYCRVTFQLPADPNAVRVPATALMPSPVRGMQVAILGADNKVTLKPVQTGRDFGDSVEVIAGLTSQDRVIDSPPETLQNGDTVRLAAATPSAQPAPSQSAGNH
ncbi:MAG TPA: efflux RND transporter periplasmic adaptor subunit [Alphaproteobacteria bacterium]